MSLERRSPKLTLTSLIGAVLLLLAGTWFAGTSGIERILEKTSRLAANGFAEHLVATRPDLKELLLGDHRGIESGALSPNERIGGVFRYLVFGADGRLRLISGAADASGNTNAEAITVPSAAAPDARILRIFNAGANEKTTQVELSSGDGRSAPRAQARILQPLMIDGSIAGVVEVHADLTPHLATIRSEMFWTFLQIAAMAIAAFLLPMAAYVQRTRQQARTAERLSFVAHHDALTKLPNRSSFNRMVDARLNVKGASKQHFSVHFIDLDRFKDVNDTSGHAVGDALLQAVADRLAEIAGPDSYIARRGGDEFAMLEPLHGDGSEPDRLAKRIVQSLSMPFPLENDDVQIAASVGFACFPEDGATESELLCAADNALYHAKHTGRARAIRYEPGFEAERRRRLSVETRLKRAIANDELELHYQPLYDASGSSLRGFEALMRLTDEDGVEIPPSEFVPIAEELGLIQDLGAWVLNVACRAASLWPEKLGVAVNLSPLQFAECDIVNIIADALRKTELEPNRLEIEVTESILMTDTEGVLADLAAIKDMGVSVALDDFGTGYSSLSYLWRFPFDKIKIDRSFVSELAAGGARSREVMDTIVALCKALNLRVTAEGIETIGQMDALRDMHIDFVQGFYYGLPLPVGELDDIIVKGAGRDAELGMVSQEPVLAAAS